jgi:hypothetical protein
VGLNVGVRVDVTVGIGIGGCIMLGGRCRCGKRL